MPADGLPSEWLKYVAAPMVNQSDLPFRILTRRYGFTMAYTQMWLSDRLVEDEEYRKMVLDDLRLAADEPLSRPVVVQLAGNDPDLMVRAGQIVEPYCDAVDINLGCPQDQALQGHYGGYLLGRRDLSLVESIILAMSSSLSVPVHVKIRLCNPASDTPLLAVNLARSGASVIALHARHVAIRRRRGGPAQLDWVAEVIAALKAEGLDSRTKVISNGNVRVFEDCEKNLATTGADGLMIGEALLENPTFLSLNPDNTYPHPIDISLEYLYLGAKYPVASDYTISHHLKAFFRGRLEYERTAYFKTFLFRLQQCHGLQDFRDLLNDPELHEAWRNVP